MSYVLEEYRKGKWTRVGVCDSADFLVNSALMLGYRSGKQGYPMPTVRVVRPGQKRKGGAK